MWKRPRTSHVYGCGEQMSYFDLRGRHFPLRSSEPGVGRDKTTYVTWRSDVENGGAGGDYYNTNYPQPTYVSSRHYYLHMDTTAYGDFDFRNPRYHELQCWNVPGFIRIEAAPTFVELLEKLTAFLGRQPELPEWIYNASSSVPRWQRAQLWHRGQEPGARHQGLRPVVPGLVAASG